VDITNKEAMTVLQKPKQPLQNRCFNCNKLLGIGDPGDIIIKCPRCSKLNRLTGSAPTAIGRKLSRGKVNTINFEGVAREPEHKAKVLRVPEVKA
jgi:phage FluMu protein Com